MLQALVAVKTGYVGPDRWSLWGNIRKYRTLSLKAWWLAGLSLGGKSTES